MSDSAIQPDGDVENIISNHTFMSEVAQADHLQIARLADDVHRARYVDGSEIEAIRFPKSGLAIAHAIFDHDGTISTLRQGWERIMQPMMLRAVLGTQLIEASTDLCSRVTTAVNKLIDRTTGIQTLAQMQALTSLVRHFGCVAESEILDAQGYKDVYNEALLAHVRQRLSKLEASELEPVDFQIKGAVAMLQQLRAAGVRLYLASGTDQDDVRAEAAKLGYAALFDGGIFGAVGDLAQEAKREVIDRILRDNDVAGDRLLVLGDGPVEMSEGRRRGALCVGVASDEPRRHGLDHGKRRRLIRAGADLVVPDFTQSNRLLALLNIA